VLLALLVVAEGALLLDLRARLDRAEQSCQATLTALGVDAPISASRVQFAGREAKLASRKFQHLTGGRVQWLEKYIADQQLDEDTAQAVRGILGIYALQAGRTLGHRDASTMTEQEIEAQLEIEDRRRRRALKELLGDERGGTLDVLTGLYWDEPLSERLQ